MSTRPATRTTSSPLDPRTESGERRIALPVDLQATRVSERFRLPDDALPSDPPPPPATADDAVGRATAHIPIPEKIKLLNAALPTPQSFEPVGLALPGDALVPRIDVDAAPAAEDDDEHVGASAASEHPASRALSSPAAPAAPAAGRQVLNAVALFVVLLGVSALAMGLCGDFLFQ